MPSFSCNSSSISSIRASQEEYFHGFGGNEGSFDVFYNKVGGGEAKYCCGGPTWKVTAQFDKAYVLKHFTLTSSNDTPNRDPGVFQVQGSNDGVMFTNIYSDTTSASEWTARNQVIRFDGAGADFLAPAAYTYFRVNVDSPAGGSLVAVGEVELFGTAVTVPEPSIALLGAISLAGLMVRRRKKFGCY